MYSLYCNESEMAKMKLIISLNKIIGNIKKGEKAFNDLANTKNLLKRELSQENLGILKDETKQVEKKAQLKEMEDKLKIYYDSLSKLYDKYSLIAVELEKLNIKMELDYYLFGMNLFEFVSSLKIIDKQV